MAVGRAPTVGDTSGDEDDCGCDEAACGGEMEEANASVPGIVEVSMSRNIWSSETSDRVATAGIGEAGTGGGAGCESGSTADADGAGDGKAES